MPKKKSKASNRKTKSYSFDLKRDGMTQSAFVLWMVCKEQFRLKYMEGLTGRGVSIPLMFGSGMHYVYETLYGEIQKGEGFDIEDPKRRRLLARAAERYKRWHVRTQRPPGKMTTENLEKEYTAFTLMDIMWPMYVRRITSGIDKYLDLTERWKFLEVEHTFAVREGCILTRGMTDAIYRDKRERLWLLEHKNLSVIDEGYIMDTLSVNFQTMMYLNALTHLYPRGQIGGVMLNITRRPLLRQKKAETEEQFAVRISTDVADRPDWYFMRFECAVTPEDIMRWRMRTLMPLVRDFKAWYNAIVDGKCDTHYVNHEALRGIYGRASMCNAILGNRTGYYVRSKVHPELSLNIGSSKNG